MEYFRKLGLLLKQEREEDKKTFEEFTHKSSVQDRRAGGLSWYPIAIRETELGKGDYLTLKLERTTETQQPHYFRFGASATLFSQHSPAEYRLDGIVGQVAGNYMKISFRVDELPDWAEEGKLGVDLAFDDNSYEEMRKALQLAEQLHSKREEGRLVRILTGEQPPEWRRELPEISLPGLNNVQRKAVQQIIQAEDLAIVHGPPGTGKTTTLVAAIQELIRLDEGPILVVAASNAAVDLLSEKISRKGLEVVRIGNPVRVSETLQSLTLDEKISVHPQMKEIKRLKKQAEEYRSLAMKYKRSFGKAEWEQRKALLKEARSVMQEVDNIQQYLVRDALDRAQVITATLVGAAHPTLKDRNFSTVILDEATQALEPAAWIPILKGRKLVMAGDHHQLSPTVKSREAAENGLAVTLFEKMVWAYPEAVTLLSVQYRMNQEILAFSNEEFYEGKLVSANEVAHHRVFAEDPPFLFIDTAGAGFEEETAGSSLANKEEAAFLVKQFNHFWENLPPALLTANTSLSVGIIAPYKGQTDALSEAFDAAGGFPGNALVSINTVDSFQGQERDIIYISLTRSNSDNRIGFLSELRRINVAMTRARKKLVIIGDSSTLAHHAFFERLIASAESRGAYRSAWEWI